AFRPVATSAADTTVLRRRARLTILRRFFPKEAGGFMRRLPLLAVLLLPVAGPLGAQSMSQRFQQLYTFGDCGQPLCLSVNASVHGELFLPSVRQGEHNMLAFVTGSIGASLASLPFTAGSGGATFHFENGSPVETSVSSGPIFAERAQTLGKGRLVG